MKAIKVDTNFLDELNELKATPPDQKGFIQYQKQRIAERYAEIYGLDSETIDAENIVSSLYKQYNVAP